LGYTLGPWPALVVALGLGPSPELVAALEYMLGHSSGESLVLLLLFVSVGERTLETTAGVSNNVGKLGAELPERLVLERFSSALW